MSATCAPPAPRDSPGTADPPAQSTRTPTPITDYEPRHPMTFPDPEDLPNALITHAMGLTAASAAAELICAHASWLPYAYIHWDEAIAALDDRQIGDSSSASSILRIAASLADHHIPVHLACCLGNLDHVNIGLVTTAITRAN